MKSFLYALLKLSNDWNAVRTNRVPRRVGRRLFGKATGRVAAKWFG